MTKGPKNRWVLSRPGYATLIADVKTNQTDARRSFARQLKTTEQEIKSWEDAGTAEIIKIGPTPDQSTAAKNLTDAVADLRHMHAGDLIIVQRVAEGKRGSKDFVIQ